MMKKISWLLIVAISICLMFTACSDNKKTASKEIKSVTKQSKTVDNLKKDEQSSDENETKTTSETAAENNNTAVTENKESVASAETKKEEASVSLNQVRSEILKKESISDAMMLETNSISNLYGISSSQIKQSAGFVTMSGTFPHEIIMVEAVDSAAAANVASSLQNKLNEVLNQSKSYDASNYALAQQCRVNKNGNFVSLFLSPNQSEMLGVYNNYIK